MVTKATMEAALHQIIDIAKQTGEDQIIDLARNCLGLQDRIESLMLVVNIETFQTPAGPEFTLDDDIEVSATYRGQPLNISSVSIKDYDCSWVE